jgi:hypothetical protein
MGWVMFEFAVLTYGLLTSFVLSGASRNAKLARPNPPVLRYIGWFLFGASGGGAVLLFGYALWKSLTH